MVLVEDPLGLDDVEALLAPGRPRQLGDELEVVPEDLRLRRLAGEALELLPLPVDLLADLLREDERLELLLEPLEVILAALPLAQLLLDRFHLLAEEHLPLPVAQLFLDLRLDLLLRVEDVDLPLDVDERPPHAILDRERLEEELPLGRRNVDVTRHEVGELARVVGLGEDGGRGLFGKAELLGQLRRALLELLHERHEGGVGGVERRHLLGFDDDRLEPAVRFLDSHGDAARSSLEDEPRPADTALDLSDGGDRPDGVEELGGYRLDVLTLGNGEHQLLGALHRHFDGVKSSRAADGDREGDSRK